MNKNPEFSDESLENIEQLKPTVVVVGGQWGDEGKGKVVDIYAKNADIVVRYNGGPNAGHQIFVNGEKLTLSQIPSGVEYADKQLYIGRGCVIDPLLLLEEIKMLEDRGISVKGRLHISPKAQLICDHNIMMDGIGSKEVGTTKKGIGPTAADRALRTLNGHVRNIRFADALQHPEKVEAHMKGAYEDTVNMLTGLHFKKLSTPEGEDIKADLEQQGWQEKISKRLAAVEKLREYVKLDNPNWMNEQAKAGKSILFEGAQGTFLDVVEGNVPYVSSTHSLAPYAHAGGDLSLDIQRETIIVVKAILSRVGEGPMPSRMVSKNHPGYRLNNDHGREYEKANFDIKTMLASKDEAERERGFRMTLDEYGARSGRPRELGALDIPMLRKAVELNGAKGMVVNMADMWRLYSQTTLEGIPFAIAYMINGKKTSDYPSNTWDLEDAHPIFQFMPHVEGDISKIRVYQNLPQEVPRMVEMIEDETRCNIIALGLGRGREDVLVRPQKMMA